jgi:hypothetical protein
MAMNPEAPDPKLSTDLRMSSLSEIARSWSNEQDQTVKGRMRAKLLGGHWEEVCRRAVRESETEELACWLDRQGSRGEILDAVSDYRPGGTFYVRQMRAYLLCAQAALAEAHGEVERLLRAASDQTELPLGFYQDLKALLLGQALPAPVRCQRIGSLLVDQGGRGVVATLLLERLQRGTGAFYPSPLHGFVFRESQFRRAEQDARACIRSHRRWMPESDVRWSLEGLPHRQGLLRDASLGGAFATSLYCLFTDPSDLRRYAVTGELQGEGRLLPVQHLPEKLAAASAPQSRITDIVIPRGSEVPLDYRESRRVWAADTVESAFRTLQRIRKSERKRRAAKISLIAGLAATILAVALLAIESETYHFHIEGGERVVVDFGLPFASLTYREVDTGLVQSDFVSDRLSDLCRGVRWWAKAGRYGWASDALPALPLTATRARLLMRLGAGTADYMPDLLKQLGSADAGDRLSAAETIAALGDRTLQRRAARIVSRDLTDKRGEIQVRAANVLLQLDSRQTERVRKAMTILIVPGDRGGSNYVNIPALEVLLRADPTKTQYVVGFLKPLLKDRSLLIDAMAAEALFKVDQRYAEEALRILPPLLASGDAGVRERSFHALKTVATKFPERVVAVAARTPYAHNYISDGTLRAIEGMARAQDARSFDRAVLRVRDVFFFSQAYAAEASRMIEHKMANFALNAGSSENPEGSVDFLLGKMKTPLADRWAVYRTGCGDAISLVVPVARRAATRKRLYSLWRNEKRPEIRIALGEALEQL